MGTRRHDATGFSVAGLLASSLTFFAGLGFLRAVVEIWSNHYLMHRTHTLLALSFRQQINRQLLVWLGSVLAAAVAAVAIRSARSRRNDRSPADGSWIRHGENLSSGLALLAAAGVLCWALAMDLLPTATRLWRGSWVRRWAAELPDGLLVAAGILATVAVLALAYWLGMRAAYRVPQKLAVAYCGRRSFISIGLATLALVGAFNLWLALSFRSRPEASHNVVLLTLDTLRADHLASYGHFRTTTPHLDELAARGVLFENAVAQAPWTLPSVATIHTSLYPSEHGANSSRAGVASQILMLAEIFRNHLYRTIAVISQPFTSRAYGFGQGFEIFDEGAAKLYLDVSSVATTDAAIAYIEDFREERFFLWVHYFDPHFAYISHEAFPYGRDYSGPLPERLEIDALTERIDAIGEDDLRYINAVYDGEISFTDHHIGRLIRRLQELGLTDRTIVAVTADHGEAFLDRDRLGHGRDVYQEFVRVPLFVVHPSLTALRGTRVPEWVEIRGLARTLLNAAGLEGEMFNGPDLLKLAAREESPDYVFAEGSYAWGPGERKLAVMKDEWKLIRNLDDDSFELYDVESDPGERRNLYGEAPEALAELRAVLDAKLEVLQGKQSTSGQAVSLTDEETQQLRDLGYIQD